MPPELPLRESDVGAGSNPLVLVYKTSSCSYKPWLNLPMADVFEKYLQTVVT
jgi:hypothetical protein